MRVALALLAAIALRSSPLVAQSSIGPAFVPIATAVSTPNLDRPVSLSITASVREVVTRIAALAELGIVLDDSLPGLRASVTLRANKMPARQALARALEGTSLQAVAIRSGQVVLVVGPARPARSTRVTGTIHDAESGAPIEGVRLELTGTRYSAYSRDSGTFSLGSIPNGAFALRATRLGYEPFVMASLRVPEDLHAPLRISMHRATPSLSEVIVTPGYFGLLQNSPAASQSLSREQLETIPQIGEDIYRAVQRLPGVSTDDFSAKFNVRGGSGDELYVSLDGLELVEPFHLKDVGGAFSIVDIQSLGTASLTTGGFGVEYGDRLTGVFTLNTADPRTDRTHTSVGVSLMNARLTSQGGFAGGKGGWLFSARPGFLDLALKLTSVKDSIRPRYYDLFAKAQYDLGGAGRVAIHALSADDGFRYLQRKQPNITSSYRSNYAWLTWDNSFGSRLRMQSVLSASALAWKRNGERTDDGVQSAFIRDDRSLDRFAVRQDWTFDATSRLMLKWGVDAKRESAAYDYFSASRADRQEGGGSLLPDPTSSNPRDTTLLLVPQDTTIALLSPRTNKLALYVAPRLRLLPSLVLELGLRYDRESQLGEGITSPRLNLTWEPRPGTTVRGAWGKYSQSQSLFSLQAEDGMTKFAPADRAEQRILGVEQVLPWGLTGRVEAYERRLTTSRSQYANVGGDTWLFPELLWDRVRLDRQGGRDRGLELQLSRSDGRRMDWSASYALASSVDSIKGRLVPRAFDQRHAMHFDWSLHPTSNAWRLSVGGIWHSGYPYTPTILSVDTLVDTPSRLSVRASRAPGELNSQRLSSYQRIDARWTRYFETSRGRFSVFGEVYNLLDAENARGMWKALTVKGRGVVVESGVITQWPRMPIAGITWEF
jgi:hypothetical protein